MKEKSFLSITKLKKATEKFRLTKAKKPSKFSLNILRLASNCKPKIGKMFLNRASASFVSSLCFGRGRINPENLLAIKFFATTAEQYEKAQADVQKLKEPPEDTTKLRLYGLFKQASNGDVQGNRPKMMEFVARAKWDAWKSNEGMSKEEAQKKYAEVVAELLAEAGIHPSTNSKPAK